MNQEQTDELIAGKVTRHYLPFSFQIQNWEDLRPWYEELKSRAINNVEDLELWIDNRDELDSVVSETEAWRYIKYTQNTEDEQARENHLRFINEIKPRLAPYHDALNRKLADCPVAAQFRQQGFDIYLRNVRKEVSLFREENIPLFAEAETLAQEYAEIQSKMSITYNGKEYTLPQASVFLKNPDRKIRHEVYDLVVGRRMENRERLDEIYTKLVQLRHQIATNAGFPDYAEYRFAALGRFDYTQAEVDNFHHAVATEIKPLVATLLENKRADLGLDRLRPYDLDAEKPGQQPLKPFTSSNELIAKGTKIFGMLDPYLGQCLQTMQNMEHLDLDSRHGKAPGGYNYPLDETGIPFIFMNSSGRLRDMITFMHEGGHAVHSFLTLPLPLNIYRHTPSEVAELASMSMELLTMKHWELFFPTKKELKRAKTEHLESIIEILPWIATVDKFQHWVYKHPTHTVEERYAAWVETFNVFHPDAVDYTDYHEARQSSWQKQLHIFEVPFYYIEYGIAQLGALGVYMNYKKTPEKALQQYMDALRLGYTKTIPEIYATAGVEFKFTPEYVRHLAEFVLDEVNSLHS